MVQEYTNDLIHSSSPYLLQHAHNPVDWKPWSEKITEQAKKENKLILVSIGYAACHWCHVMEQESFEDEKVAEIMNEHFICIKVDREERPDVDHYYMTAVQLMRKQGGWPLNVIALPDGRPIWGGTYFPRETWVNDISAVANFYKKNSEQTEEYAEKLQNGIEQVSIISEPENNLPANSKIIENAVGEWTKKFDFENGGRIGAPKFPMPVNLEFLLHYGFIKNDQTVFDFLKLTLEKMARGGIYDQLGGGFARYSVDEYWKVPHFEKMLYDNGQLLSIYSKSYRKYRNQEFKSVVYETVDFIVRELMDETGAFYSSLDADSEGEEGKFYVWNSKELKDILKDDFDLFSKYYNVNSKGFWEQGKSILLRDSSDAEFALNNNLTENELQKKMVEWKENLAEVRSGRDRPGLDDKTITSWNALVVVGLLEAHKTFDEKYFLKIALKNARFLFNNVYESSGKIFHTWKNGKSSVDGFLEDYALLTQAALSLFEVTGKKVWLNYATNLNNYVFDHFYDEKSGFFQFSEIDNGGSLTNHFQIQDNVIPASNSVMADNLFHLSVLLGRPEYMNIVKRMTQSIIIQFKDYPMAYANWGILMMKLTEHSFEVVACGERAEELISEMRTYFLPNVKFYFSKNESNLSIFRNRVQPGKNQIYVCSYGVCKLPVESVGEAIRLLKQNDKAG